MNKRILKQLAQNTVVDGIVSEPVQTFVLSRLSRADLKSYAFYLREEQKKMTVAIRSAGQISDDLAGSLRSSFPSKTVMITEMPELGAGLQIEHGDDVVNINLKNQIERTLYLLKESL